MHGLFDATGQSWLQLEELGLAFILSSLVGFERELKQKSAGLRTNTLVGVSAALFILISKYGFMDVLKNGEAVVDPSRVAAQIVSGIGFIGGGVIFMRRDVVRGLTTAASVWLTAALGMACGAGLSILAIATTIAHFIIMLGFPRLLPLLPRQKRETTRLGISYRDGQGLLRTILTVCTKQRFAIDRFEVAREDISEMHREELNDEGNFEGMPRQPVAKGTVLLSMQVKGKRPISHLIASLSEIEGVVSVSGISNDPERD